MNLTAQDVLETVRNVVARRLDPARVIDVIVYEDEDSSGEEILRITIVFETDGNKLDPEKVLGLGRHLRDPLGELDERRHPIFTFMTPEEANGAAA